LRRGCCDPIEYFDCIWVCAAAKVAGERYSAELQCAGTTVIVVPKGKQGLPMLLTRTCYNAAERATRSDSGRMVEALPLSDEVFVEAGYIRVYQDVRGKYGSEGPYLMTPPPITQPGRTIRPMPTTPLTGW
jgi:hypothetical protein